MVNATCSIAVVPCTHFKWTAQIQYKESLSTREEAIRYASRTGCNLIVIYEKRTGPKFDVLQDPNMGSEGCINDESSETVTVAIEPESTGWSKLLFRSVFGLAKRLGSVAGHAQPAHS
jgi:hypothetical protein